MQVRLINSAVVFINRTNLSETTEKLEGIKMNRFQVFNNRLEPLVSTGTETGEV